MKRIAHSVLYSATSGPKGPVYLWARREVLQEEVDASLMDAGLDTLKWPSVQPSGLSLAGKFGFKPN